MLSVTIELTIMMATIYKVFVIGDRWTLFKVYVHDNTIRLVSALLLHRGHLNPSKLAQKSQIGIVLPLINIPSLLVSNRDMWIPRNPEFSTHYLLSVHLAQKCMTFHSVPRVAMSLSSETGQ
jgi:hypothetical protein